MVASVFSIVEAGWVGRWRRINQGCQNALRLIYRLIYRLYYFILLGVWFVSFSSPFVPATTVSTWYVDYCCRVLLLCWRCWLSYPNAYTKLCRERATAAKRDRFLLHQPAYRLARSGPRSHVVTSQGCLYTHWIARGPRSRPRRSIAFFFSRC